MRWKDKEKKLINTIQKYLKENLSEKRYKHSIGVMKKAEELAQIYNVDLEEAKLAGLAHDIAKEMTKEEYIKYAQDNNIKLNKEDKEVTPVLHAIIGADICKNKYGFTKRMQNAIKYHSTGRARMNMLEKIIFIADKIEENRQFEGIERIRKLAQNNIDDAVKYFLDYTIEKCEKQKLPIHTQSIKARKYFL